MNENFLIITRIGPMEGGLRDGQYLEAGEIVGADVFNPESIAILLELGIIAGTQSVPSDPAPIVEELNHVTDDSNSH